ncbi:MAG: MFS transporter [Deltaproteobacteria bacterium]|nr:MFS transporter [Deltaproteobacteria bacterium]
MPAEHENNMAKAWRILWVAVAINLLCGFGYAWSLFKVVIRQSIETGGAFDWDIAALNDPFAAFNLVFAFSTILTGPLYDRWGPRFTSTFGMVCVGGGLAICGLSTNYWAWVFGWGVLAPFGISWTYAATTPTVMKWFPIEKMGLVTGIVVAGTGISPVYIAPLTHCFLDHLGLSQTLLVIGGYSTIIGVLCALYLSDPYKIQKSPIKFYDHLGKGITRMIKSSLFWRIWLLFFIGGGVGLMVVGSVADMAAKSLGEAAFLALAFLALGNGLGRIGGGYITDRFGRKPLLVFVSTFQAILMIAAVFIVSSEEISAVIMILLTSLVGFNYGTNTILFPTISRDLWGVKNFGLNYGLVFTAWGAGGFMMARMSQMLLKVSDSYTASFIVGAVLLVLAIFVTLYTPFDH